jgi:hypothetical protein
MKRLIPERNKNVNEIIDIDYCGTTRVLRAEIATEPPLLSGWNQIP